MIDSYSGIDHEFFPGARLTLIREFLYCMSLLLSPHIQLQNFFCFWFEELDIRV
jgi:hypothetical protein